MTGSGPSAIALANVRYPATPEESVAIAEGAVAARRRRPARPSSASRSATSRATAASGRRRRRRTPRFSRARGAASPAAAAKAKIAVVLGTERVEGNALYATALVIGPDGARARLPGQGAARPVRGRDVHAGGFAPRLHGRTAHVRRRHLPRGLALPRDGALRRAPRRAGRLPPAPRAGRRRRLLARRRSRTRGTRSTRRRSSAARPRTRS